MRTSLLFPTWVSRTRPSVAALASASLVGASLVGTALAGTGCGGRPCEEIAAEADTLRASWAECSGEAAVCVLLAGGDADCTGRLGCAFAVREDVADEAQVEASRLVDEASGCESCSMAGCAVAVGAFCDVDPETGIGACTVAR